MTRQKFEEKMDEFGFRKTFESSYESVWNSGRNQLELIKDGRILLSRGCMVTNFPLKALEDISEMENTWPEILVFSLPNEMTIEIEYKH